MTDQPEHPKRDDPNARAANGERLTFADAAERLNISTDAVRMRVHRGTLATVRVNGQTRVLWPQPERTHARRTHQRTRSARPSSVQHDGRVIARLESEVSFLRGELTARTEELRRKDHLLAAALERIPELPATAETPPQGTIPGPVGDDQREGVSNTLAGLIARLRARIRS